MIDTWYIITKLNQIKLNPEQLVAEVLDIMRKFETDILPIYKNSCLIGEASYAELSEFVGEKDDPKNVYYHKVNFDLWTAVTLIGENRKKQDAITRQEEELAKNQLKKQTVTWVLAVAIFVLLLGGVTLFYRNIPSFSGKTERPADNYILTTVATPKGKINKITLSDGTTVWLNAESSIRFPVKFGQGLPRKVFLKGEGYFEVSKMNPEQPFIVVTDKQSVEVLGTHFNINAYNDEKCEKTTVLKGAVKVRPSGPKSVAVILKRNQMTTLVDSHIEVQTIDTDMVTAWKRGEFTFRNESLESVMRVLTRWYNLEVSYENDEIRNLTLGGSISKSQQVSAVLKMLELTGDVHFKIEGRKVVVK